MKNIFFFITLAALFSSCTKQPEANKENKVLMLKVDYLTNTFEGGKEFTFNTPATTFSIIKDFVPPADFGYLKLKYAEVNELLFDGSIIWAGVGKINFPQELLPASQFNVVNTNDVVNPTNGFENIFNPSNAVWDYSPVWLSVQKLVKVREYLSSSPAATVKLFLYTPSVGAGNPADADWIIYLKK